MKASKARHWDEDAVDTWVQSVDLSKENIPFKPADFNKLKRTEWTRFYEKNQKTMPLSLRLPEYFVTKVKQQAMALGLPYQVLIRLWIAEKIGLR
jgi:predicted DNA binding CopG/RHH family protein